MKGYESLKEWEPMDELIFEEPHVTGGVARIHIRVYQILQFMDAVYKDYDHLPGVVGSDTPEKPSDDTLVTEFIANHGAYKRDPSPAPVMRTWQQAMSDYWRVKP